jgi:hypothetical protein
MKRTDNQSLSNTTPRLQHAIVYATIRALELDMDRERNSLTINHFQDDLDCLSVGVGEGFLIGTLYTNLNTPLNLQSKQKDPPVSNIKTKRV